ncbi:hypothetical protein [Streptomyces sp. NPDC060027]
MGKSVLMRDAAHLLAASGQGPVLVVVGLIVKGWALPSSWLRTTHW